MVCCGENFLLSTVVIPRLRPETEHDHRPDHVTPEKCGHIVRVLGMSDSLFSSLLLQILLVLVEVLPLF